jgi:hypothetical protein
MLLAAKAIAADGKGENAGSILQTLDKLLAKPAGPGFAT